VVSVWPTTASPGARKLRADRQDHRRVRPLHRLPALARGRVGVEDDRELHAEVHDDRL
jgi:hypothetical protein